MNEIAIPRNKHALQIECVYTEAGHRGKGLTGKIIEEQIRYKKAAGAIFDKAQIILLRNNENAVKAYRKAGFEIVKEKTAEHDVILNLLPCDTKILMEINIKN